MNSSGICDCDDGYYLQNSICLSKVELNDFSLLKCLFDLFQPNKLPIVLSLAKQTINKQHVPLC